MFTTQKVIDHSDPGYPQIRSYKRLAPTAIAGLGAAGTALSTYLSRGNAKRFRGSYYPTMPYTRRRGRAAGVIQRAFRASRYRQARMVRRRVPVQGRGVTFEHDRQFIYRKKRMGRRQRRRWTSFKRKVTAVAEKGLGSRTVVMNQRYTVSANTIGTQLVANYALYSNNSTNAWLDDLNQIAALENVGDQTAAAGETIDDTTKFFFQSGILDLTIRNTSHLTEDVTNLNTECTLEVDVYEMTVKRPLNDAPNGQYQDLITAFAVGQISTKNIGGAGTDVQIVRRGVTPWDITTALSRQGIKIAKKTKMFIRNGQTATYQMRDPKRHVTTKASLTAREGCNRRGWTKWIFIIAKAIPGIDVGPVAGQTTMKLDVGVTRKYLYKIEGMNEDRDRYLTI